jgi:hypothetical protein
MQHIESQRARPRWLVGLGIERWKFGRLRRRQRWIWELQWVFQCKLRFRELG